MFTQAQMKAFQRGLAACDAHAPAIKRLEMMAQYAPHFADRIREISLKEQTLRALATIALATDQ